MMKNGRSAVPGLASVTRLAASTENTISPGYNQIAQKTLHTRFDLIIVKDAFLKSGLCIDT
jgi:hypothetical protein